VKRDEVQGWVFELDEDALITQAKEGLPDDVEAVYVGCLPVEVEGDEQEEVAQQLMTQFNCHPVFLGAELKNNYYKSMIFQSPPCIVYLQTLPACPPQKNVYFRFLNQTPISLSLFFSLEFCKQQLWPMMHYLIPLNPNSTGRFDPGLWSAYVRANMAFCSKLVEVLGSLEDDFVWIHDYHLLVLPSLLRKRFHRIKCGFFLHSPFPSSEIFRTFPRREEVLRSLLNADLVGFHTFDYARHFLSCCSRMLGLEHKTSRGSIIVEYYGRDVGIKIMPTGVKPERLLAACSWPDTAWRRGELAAQFQGKTVLIGVDDMDVFKGIELKLAAFEQVLTHHPEWRGKLVLIQVTSAARAPGRDVDDLHTHVISLVESINAKYRSPGYEPVVWLERPVPLYERIALYSIADVAVVTATRDGMNLMPYEYIVCRQGPNAAETPSGALGLPPQSGGGGGSGADNATPTTPQSPSSPASTADGTGVGSLPTQAQAAVSPRTGPTPLRKHASMLVVSEFVGCSPSLSGALRVNPWSIDAVRDAIYAAIRLPHAERLIRHDKHWKYVSSHTVKFWAKSYVADLQRFTKDHSKLQCFDLGFALDTFRMVALTSDFRKLQAEVVMKAYAAAQKRVFLLDHDGTLVPQSSITSKPGEGVLRVLRSLTADPNNSVYIISGRARDELDDWFSMVPRLGLAAEHGFYLRRPGATDWSVLDPDLGFGWKDIVLPILQLYTESTDGSSIESKESALVWHYNNADPDFGSWQAKELLDHLEGVLANEPVEVVPGATIVEVKPQGVSKGKAAERILAENQSTLSDFVLCIGNDRSDEDMFNAMPSKEGPCFACTVGQKPSKAPFYVNDPTDVVTILGKLTDVDGAAAVAPTPSVSFAT
jgi:trehalose 6-phosphate synthase/phosphatase